MGYLGWGEQMSKSIYSEGTPRGHRGLRNTLQWPDETVICVSMCMCGLVREVAVTPIPLDCYHQQKQRCYGQWTAS